MKTSRKFSLILLSFLVLGLLFGTAGNGRVLAQVEPTATPSQAPTAAPAATATIGQAAGRPLVYLAGYSTDKGTLVQGDTFMLKLDVRNKGGSNAVNVVLSFASDSFLPLQTGGVKTLAEIIPGEAEGVNQPFMVNAANKGAPAVITVAVSYTDPGGASYTENFTITLYVSADPTKPVYTGPARPTVTPTAIMRPQLVVNAYSTDVDPLQPGSIFQLEINVRNLGNANARSVTMVLGGGVVSGDNGTPQPGTQGSGSDLATFAPLGSSNLVFLGDVSAAAEIKTNQRLIVNVSANPGAYTFKLSFVYTDPGGIRYVDDQVITLLVYKLPQVEVNFYRDPGIFFAGQMGMLPVQVTNLGRSLSVLGNMKIVAENAEVTNNVALVGALDAGGYFTLDSNLVPFQAGPLELKITVNYTDDFNQPRVIEQVLTVDVQDMPVVEPPTDGIPPENMPAAPETFMDKVVRFFKGLFGLGSEQTEPVNTLPVEGIPSDGKPINPESVPVVPGGKG